MWGRGLSVETAAREGNSLFQGFGLFIQFEIIQNNAAYSAIRTCYKMYKRKIAYNVREVYKISREKMKCIVVTSK
jgi:hypothetical protein